MQPSSVESLGLLLATQSFLLAATAIISTTGGVVPRIHIPGWLSASVILFTGGSVGAGCLAAWGRIYSYDFILSSAGVIGFALLVAIVGQALLTILLALRAS